MVPIPKHLELKAQLQLVENKQEMKHRQRSDTSRKHVWSPQENNGEAGNSETPTPGSAEPQTE